MTPPLLAGKTISTYETTGDQDGIVQMRLTFTDGSQVWFRQAHGRIIGEITIPKKQAWLAGGTFESRNEDDRRSA